MKESSREGRKIDSGGGEGGQHATLCLKKRRASRPPRRTLRHENSNNFFIASIEVLSPGMCAARMSMNASEIFFGQKTAFEQNGFFSGVAMLVISPPNVEARVGRQKPSPVTFVHATPFIRASISFISSPTRAVARSPASKSGRSSSAKRSAHRRSALAVFEAKLDTLTPVQQLVVRLVREMERRNMKPSTTFHYMDRRRHDLLTKGDLGAGVRELLRIELFLLLHLS